MTDESNTGSIPAIKETAAEVKSPNKERKSARRQKPPAEPVREVKVQGARPRKFSVQERIAKLKLIETHAKEGASPLKDAIKSAGISEQTYYQWKKAAKTANQTADKPLTAGDELADLVRLEAENQKLRKLLAEKLRAENAELRKRLGLD